MTDHDFTTYRIPAVCGCGREHTTQTFLPPSSDNPPRVTVTCDECLTAAEAEVAARHKPIAPRGGKRAQARAKKLDDDHLDEVRRRAEQGQRTKEDQGEWYR